MIKIASIWCELVVWRVISSEHHHLAKWRINFLKYYIDLFILLVHKIIQVKPSILNY